MEGKSLWQIQSLPIETWEILHAKENMSVQLNVYPAILFAIVGGTVFKLQIGETALACCAIWFYVWLISDFGLFLNLKNPNLNWTNEATLTKQSGPVMINLFGGWAFCVALGFGGYYLCKIVGTYGALAILTALFAVLWALLHNWLKTRGTEILSSL